MAPGVVLVLAAVLHDSSALASLSSRHKSSGIQDDGDQQHSNRSGSTVHLAGQ